tara:strand:- start:257 stop:529 length:273 start_codon:yes stop_codon:yes gene_type:complete
MSNVIEVQFGKGILPDEDEYVNELQPLLEDMVEVSCDNYGEELGCLMIESLCLSLEKIRQKLSEQIENKKKYILTMENGDIIDLTLETNE